MSEINQNINNINDLLDSTIDNLQPTKNNTKKDSPVLQIVNNIINVISNILKILPKNNYTNEDKINIYNCINNIKYKLKLSNISDNIEDLFIDLKDAIENLPTSRVISISGDLYTLNNCLITFNSKLHQPLSHSTEHFNQNESNNSLSK